MVVNSLNELRLKIVNDIHHVAQRVAKDRGSVLHIPSLLGPDFRLVLHGRRRRIDQKINITGAPDNPPKG